jgi:RNA polymerase sigma factor (sigma-70 family)
MSSVEPATGGRPAEPPSARSVSASWAAAVERYARLIVSIPLRFGLSREDAEDVLQSTVLTAMRREKLPPSEDRIVRWFASIASWETRNLLRKRAPEPLEPDEVEGLSPGAEPPRALLEEAEELQALADALATLKPRERRLLEALFLEPEPLSYQEVAARIGVAVGSVGELRRRAIDRLRAELVRRGF